MHILVCHRDLSVTLGILQALFDVCNIFVLGDLAEVEFAVRIEYTYCQLHYVYMHM